jgi:hypothetical protein
MHDKAHSRFYELNNKEREDFYVKLNQKYDINLIEKREKPIILVSSSSWTEDEDFHILIDALDSKWLFSLETLQFKPNTAFGPLFLEFYLISIKS